jgi:hypothetical protein
MQRPNRAMESTKTCRPYHGTFSFRHGSRPSDQRRLRAPDSQGCDAGVGRFERFCGRFDIGNSDARVRDVQPRTFFVVARTIFLGPTSSATGAFRIPNSAFQSKLCSGHQTAWEPSPTSLSELSDSHGKLPSERGSLGAGELDAPSSACAVLAEKRAYCSPVAASCDEA